MSFTAQDDVSLRQALGLARGAVGLASPNPTVGCVLVRDGQVLGEGAHHYDAFDHAEIAALKQAAARGHDVRGATAHVTLEPCSFYGRTGPCADALVTAGIARCVIATVDPHPRVSGTGIAKLTAAGVDVVVVAPDSRLAQQARRLNDAFAFSARYGRPFVTLKAAVSLDGKLAPASSQRKSREPFWLTGAAARADVQQLRHRNDAIVTGIGTVLADDPVLTDRTGLPRRRPLLRVVLDSELRLPVDSRMVANVANDLLVMTSLVAPQEQERELASLGVEVLRVAENEKGRIDLAAMLAALYQLQIRSLLLEAGSALNGAFLAAGLVDRVVLYISETELGNDVLPFAAGQASPYALQQDMTFVMRKSFPHAEDAATEDVRISGYLRDPWANLLIE